MTDRLNRMLERPWLLPLVFFGMSFVFVAIDAAYFAVRGGAGFREALFSPAEYDLFIRATVIVLAAVAAGIGEMVLRRYRRTAAELHAEQRRLQSLYDTNPAAIITLDRDMTVSYLNTKAQELVGLPAARIKDHACHLAIMGSDQLCEGCLVPQVIETGRPHSRIKHEITAGGKENWISQVWYPLLAADGSVESVVEIAADVSELKLDPLTGLPNRILFRDRMEVAMASARRHSQRMAVLFMDIDGFKGINDSLGHAAGDTLLTGFAERLRGIVRQDETLARISGDEFAILLPSVEGHEDAEIVASRVIDQLKNPFVLGGKNAPITVSIGAAVYDGGDTSLEVLLARADSAMYEVKDRGGNGYQQAE